MTYAAADARCVAEESVPPSLARSATGLGRVVACRDLDAAVPAWSRLEREATFSPYQTLAWQRAWLETRGRLPRIEPLIVIAYDEADEPLALIPLCVGRHGPGVASFLGGRDANFNMGLFRPDVEWNRGALEALLRRAARACRPQIRLYALNNQPYGWNGSVNPLSLLSHQPSPSFGHKAILGRDPDSFFKATLSGDTRKKLRRKAERLAANGRIEHRVARTPDEASAIIDAFEAQRRSRCATLGLNAADVPGQIELLRRASIAEADQPTVELHALLCDGRILATFGGTARRERFCGMVISFDEESDLARFSPGDLLLASIIRSKCQEGFSVFDLGVGEARYKDAFCPEIEPLFDTLLPVSAIGWAAAAREAVRLRAKRTVKQSAWGWTLAKRLRRSLSRVI